MDRCKVGQSHFCNTSDGMYSKNYIILPHLDNFHEFNIIFNFHDCTLSFVMIIDEGKILVNFNYQYDFASGTMHVLSDQ